jgi:dCMP deaminase
MRIQRLPWDKYWMVLAHLTATRSTCDRGPELLFDPDRHGVGAVLVRDGRCIAGGYNGSAPGQPHCDDLEAYLQCNNCGEKFEGETYDFVPRKGKKGRCPKCNAGVFVTEHKGGHIMRDGHCVRTIHSEMNAMLQCALDGTSPQAATLFTTASPCFDCAKAIIRANIARVVYGQPYDSRYGLSKDVEAMLKDSSIRVDQLVVTRGELE